jgi:hypothetical protein
MLWHINLHIRSVHIVTSLALNGAGIDPLPETDIGIYDPIK